MCTALAARDEGPMNTPIKLLVHLLCLALVSIVLSIAGMIALFQLVQWVTR